MYLLKIRVCTFSQCIQIKGSSSSVSRRMKCQKMKQDIAPASVEDPASCICLPAVPIFPLGMKGSGLHFSGSGSYPQGGRSFQRQHYTCACRFLLIPLRVYRKCWKYLAWIDTGIGEQLMLQEVLGKYLPFASGEVVDGCISVSNCTAACYNAVMATVISWRWRTGYNLELPINFTWNLSCPGGWGGRGYLGWLCNCNHLMPWASNTLRQLRFPAQISFVMCQNSNVCFNLKIVFMTIKILSTNCAVSQRVIYSCTATSIPWKK